MEKPPKKYRGVSWHKRYHCWRVKIGSHGRHVFLGNYQDPATAARVYDAAAMILHRRDAVLNFPDAPPSKDLLTKMTHLLLRKKALAKI